MNVLLVCVPIGWIAGLLKWSSIPTFLLVSYRGLLPEGMMPSLILPAAGALLTPSTLTFDKLISLLTAFYQLWKAKSAERLRLPAEFLCIGAIGADPGRSDRGPGSALWGYSWRPSQCNLWEHHRADSLHCSSHQGAQHRRGHVTHWLCSLKPAPCLRQDPTSALQLTEAHPRHMALPDKHQSYYEKPISVSQLHNASRKTLIGDSWQLPCSLQVGIPVSTESALAAFWPCSQGLAVQECAFSVVGRASRSRASAR